MPEKTALHDVAAHAGATFAQEAGWLVADHFGAPAREYNEACGGAVLFDLSQRGKIELLGADARLFLHNLCTNNVKDLAPGQGCEAFLTTAKARVVAPILAGRFQLEDHDVVRLDMEPGLNEKVLQHLGHYLISEQVELADRTRELAQLRLAGPQARRLLEGSYGVRVEQLSPFHHVAAPAARGGPLHIRRSDVLSVPAFDLFSSAADAVHFWDDLSARGAVPAGRQAHETLRVEAGWPVFGKDIDDNRLVMEVGRTKEAICYTKGCFLGQEPIVMARDRGQVNRTLLGVMLATQEVLAAGARLFDGDIEAGQVTSSVYSPRLAKVLALAYLRRGHQHPGRELVVEPASDGRRATVAELPFITGGHA